jgi:hypothetical protein
LRIERYFEHVRHHIEACHAVQAFDVAYDKRSTYEGFIRGEIRFIDGSVLHVREFIDTEIHVDRLTYVYQYMGSSGDMVFRYDNTGHHRRLNLRSYPHHRHLGSEDAVVASDAPTLAEVLDEIGGLVEAPRSRDVGGDV